MSGGIFGVILVAVAVGLIVWRARRDAFKLPSSYGDGLRSFRSNSRKWMLLVGVLLVGSAPVGLSWLGYGSAHVPKGFMPGMPFNDVWLNILSVAGVWAIAAMGLNLLLGNTGQISLGHSAFLAIGAFGLGYFGNRVESSTTAGLLHVGLDLHGLIVLIIVTIIGGVVAAAIGPFALRLRGNYLAIVSLVLVFGAQHLVTTWDSLTGGEGNPRTLPSLNFGNQPNPVFLRDDGGATNVFNSFYFANPSGSPTDKPGYFWAIWTIVGLMAFVAHNLLRTRQGRAMMAVRDRDLSAEVIGVRQMYTKTWAFAIAGAYGALAGALYGSLLGTVNSETFALTVAIAFVTMIVIGGVGSVTGSIVGALIYVLVPNILNHFQASLTKLPFIQADPAKSGLTIYRFTNILFGVMVIVFLIYFPEGLVGIWRRVKRSAMTWPLR
jgi:branched-chain amino acid transport system permease protein